MKSLGLICAFIFYFAATVTYAAPCNHKNVKTISALPTFVKQPAQFDYKYQYFPASKPDAPVVIFLTGGPGQTAIGTKMKSFPENFGQILIDPRGIGCNQPNSATSYPTEFYATDNYVQDLLAVIKDTGLTKNIIIYGVSYGTIVATQLAAEMERSGINPKSVVLEGILAKAFDEKVTPFHSYIKPLQGIYDQLSKKAQSRLEKILAGESHLGMPSTRWFSYLTRLIIIGYIPFRWEMQIAELDIMLSQDPKTQRVARAQNLIDFSLQNSPLLEYSNFSDHALLLQPTFLRDPAQKKQVIDPRLHQRALYKSVACGEIEAYSDLSLGFAKGQFVMVRDAQRARRYKICQPGDMTRPYDSADHQIQAPIYYMQGLEDPATPHDRALYHFENQRVSQNRYFVSFDRTGHNPLSGNMTHLGGGCHLDFWKDVAKSKSPQKSMAKCGLKHDLKIN